MKGRGKSPSSKKKAMKVLTHLKVKGKNLKAKGRERQMNLLCVFNLQG
jgi:hypothetical protein